MGNGSSKTTEIYTHVSKKSLANIKSPLDTIIESQYVEKQEFNMNKKQYDRESANPNKSLVSFYDKMEKRFGKRGWATRQRPKNLRLASERSA